MGKSLIIVILGSLMTLITVNVSYVKVITSGSDNAISYYENVQARNLGNSMVNILLSRIADSAQYRTDGFEKSDIGDGIVNYRVVDTAFVEGDTLVKIQTKIEYNTLDKYITTFLYPGAEPGGWVPPVVRAAWTANADLNKTISDMYIDGRNHDLSLNLVPGTGVYGVSSSVAFTNSENAAIGGTVDTVDYHLSYPENPAIIEQNYDWGGKFPESPDEVVGYPEGTLKSLAKTGKNGSQYLLNPSEKIEKDLAFPLSGVTYIELTDGKERKLTLEGFYNKGILIIHGPNASSRIKGLSTDAKKKATKVKDGDPIIFCHRPGTIDQITMSTAVADTLSGHLGHGDMLDDCPEIDGSWFEGLIITDYSFHHHLDILGGVIQLSSDLELAKNCNGNKDHWVKYSAEAIRNSTGFTATETGLVGNNLDALRFRLDGFGCGRQKAAFWYE